MKIALALLAFLFLCWPAATAARRLGRRASAAEQRARTALGLVESIALAIEAKDRTSERHLRRMRIYAAGIGRRLGIPPAELEALEYAALLHDIGKLVVPESILSKPSGLSSEEFQLMSAHARVGAEILQTTMLPSTVVAMVRHHHERYDGTGYPDGLTGMEIPLGARILAAADAFEALTSERPYRPGMPVPQAIAYLQRHSGIHFDPRVVRILVERHAEFEEQVVAQEKSLAATAGSRSVAAGRRHSADAATGADTHRIAPPLQVVLDRIASSHMEVYSLHEITQALGSSLNLDESFALIVGKLRRLIHFSSCAIFLFDPDSETLSPRFASGAAASRLCRLSIPLGQKVTGWAALQRRPALAGPGQDPGAGGWDLEAFADDPDAAALRSCVAAPLLLGAGSGAGPEDGEAGESLVGVITLYDEAGCGYTPQEQQLLALAAPQVACAIRTGLLLEKTQEHALTDSLTGLPNSRYMFMVFGQEAARAREQGAPLTLMVLDIDRFREINDDFGHHAGDRFLVGMAKAIRSQMRLCDTCIRFSGDEFVAIMPGLAGAEVEAVVERLADAARDYSMEPRPGRPVRLGLSIGHATLPADGQDFESLMAVAEARMKEDKNRHSEGGDRPLVIPFGPVGGLRKP